MNQKIEEETSYKLWAIGTSALFSAALALSLLSIITAIFAKTDNALLVGIVLSLMAAISLGLAIHSLLMGPEKRQ